MRCNDSPGEPNEPLYESTWVLSPGLLGYYLEWIASRFNHGFQDAEIEQALAATEWLGLNECRTWEFRVEFRHQPTLLKLRIELADIETLHVTIRTVAHVVQEINLSARSCYDQLIEKRFLPSHYIFHQPM
jgi:hypothetical protein